MMYINFIHVNMHKISFKIIMFLENVGESVSHTTFTGLQNRIITSDLEKH